MIRGIDVSAHQGKIDWRQVKADGVAFAILRAGYGKDLSQKDPWFDYNLKEAAANGISIGAYWFSYATSVAEAKQEADLCHKILQGAALQHPVFFDWEDDSLRYCRANGVTPNKAMVTDFALAFLKRMESYGWQAGLYANPSYLNLYFDLTRLKDTPLWLAQWGISQPCRSCAYWQYSDAVTVKGIAGRVDGNYCYTKEPVVKQKSVKTAKTTADLNLRKEAHTAATVLQVLPKGTTVTLLADDDWGWSKVSAAGKVGWVSNVYLTAKDRSAYRTGICNGTNVNFRAAPSLAAAVLKQLGQGDRFKVIAILPNGWLHAAHSGREGYLYYDRSYLQL